MNDNLRTMLEVTRDRDRSEALHAVAAVERHLRDLRLSLDAPAPPSDNEILYSGQAVRDLTDALIRAQRFNALRLVLGLSQGERS